MEFQYYIVLKVAFGHSSHTRLAAPEVVDRGLAETVLKPSIGVGTFT